MSYRYRRDYYADPAPAAGYYYDNYYSYPTYRQYATPSTAVRTTYRNVPGYYTTRDGRWPDTGATYRHSYEMPTKATTARRGVFDQPRQQQRAGWYSDPYDYYDYPPVQKGRISDANVWDIMNHHRDVVRRTPGQTTTGRVYYDYNGRPHATPARLPPLYR
jgi:hypothetical protein